MHTHKHISFDSDVALKMEDGREPSGSFSLHSQTKGTARTPPEKNNQKWGLILGFSSSGAPAFLLLLLGCA